MIIIMICIISTVTFYHSNELNSAYIIIIAPIASRVSTIIMITILSRLKIHHYNYNHHHHHNQHQITSSSQSPSLPSPLTSAAYELLSLAASQLNSATRWFSSKTSLCRCSCEIVMSKTVNITNSAKIYHIISLFMATVTSI